jgi:hypothetical protein
MESRIHLYVAAACAVVLALAAPTLAGDPDMLQDVCVADMASCKSTTTISSTSAKILVVPECPISCRSLLIHLIWAYVQRSS